MAAPKARKQAKAELEDEERFAALRELLESLGWVVTVSRSLDGRGGDCLVRGARRAIVSRRLPVSERIEVLVEALRREDLDGVFVRPDLRALVVGGSGADAAAGGPAPGE